MPSLIQHDILCFYQYVSQVHSFSCLSHHMIPINTQIQPHLISSLGFSIDVVQIVHPQMGLIFFMGDTYNWNALTSTSTSQIFFTITTIQSKSIVIFSFGAFQFSSGANLFQKPTICLSVNIFLLQFHAEPGTFSTVNMDKIFLLILLLSRSQHN